MITCYKISRDNGARNAPINFAFVPENPGTQYEHVGHGNDKDGANELNARPPELARSDNNSNTESSPDLHNLNASNLLVSCTVPQPITHHKFS